ncbi:helix-turn-helix transcriptional regulator [Amycolatopsis acidicola]|uniref:Helix-turn-helix transcriptional regulator n=1 Tax=Amycolatopsis acidicola TaxID=2596893 RepID=A0A5N0VIF4_9PSEU|nr:helix-turn-helix transcriptional regulator [Amycolatopsis acidicola]
MATKRTGLVRARKAAGYTQESLAYTFGVDPSTVVRWERGTSEPSPNGRPLGGPAASSRAVPRRPWRRNHSQVDRRPPRSAPTGSP